MCYHVAMSSPRQFPRSAGADDDLAYDPWLDDDLLPEDEAAPGPPARRSQLESCDLTDLFGPTGALAAAGNESYQPSPTMSGM